MPKTYVYTAFGGPETQQFVDWEKPTPGEGQLLVRVKAAGVNPADWKGRHNYRRLPDPPPGPTPMGLEVSGIVEALGSGVSDFAVGDAVFGSVAGNGGFSEYSLLPVGITAHKPPSVSFLDAATLPVAAATAYDGIQQLKLAPGETLLVTGVGGGVGIAAAQIAVANGVRVIGTASPGKKELVESVGAIHVAYGEGTRARIEAIAPQGVDAIYDMVGGEALAAIGDLVHDGSRLITAADLATAEKFGGSRVERARTAAVLEILGQMVAAGSLKPFVTEVFPLEQAGEALALVEGGHATGKVVIEVS